MLIDTDVLIWYLRGNNNALRVVEKQEQILLSVITYMELVQGMRNTNELQQLRRTLRLWDAEILYLSEEISIKAMFLMEKFYLSHSLEIADGLIAATAIVNTVPLLTGNSKHYRIIPDINLVSFRP